MGLFLAIHLIIMARGLLKLRLRLILTMVVMVMEEVMVEMPTDLLMAMDIDVDTMERGLLMLKLLLMHLMAKGLLSLMGSLVTFMVLVLELPDILAMLPAMSEELFLAIHLIIMARGLLKPRLRLVLTTVVMVMEGGLVGMLMVSQAGIPMYPTLVMDMDVNVKP